MRTINPIEYLTIRKGKLTVTPIYENDVHPFEFKWHDDGAFGIGHRGFSGLINGEFHCIGIEWEKIYQLSNKSNPKKIKVEFHPNHFHREEKGGFRVVYPNHSIDLKNIFKLDFEDDETKIKFHASCWDLFDYIQPKTNDSVNCEVYWDFNPYALNDTGFRSWGNPKYVEVIFNGVVEESKDERIDSFGEMERAIRYKGEHLRDLSEYTGINFKL